MDSKKTTLTRIYKYDLNLLRKNSDSDLHSADVLRKFIWKEKRLLK